MIEPEDLMIPGISSVHSKLAAGAPGSIIRATDETIAARFSELESRPVVGAYDATHLQEIHARIFEGLFPWAGQFREAQSSAVTSSLDVLFDRLAREHRLKGLDGDAWSKRSTEYFREITAIKPFIDGNEIASLEFFRQLASENNMMLRCVNGVDEPTSDELQSQLQRTQSSTLRRILMFAVDPYPAVQPHRALEGRNILELIAPA